MRVFFHIFGQFGYNRLAGAIVDSFRYRDDAATEALIYRFDVGNKAVHIEGPFGKINQVRPVIIIFTPHRRCSREKTGVTAHNHPDIDTL